MAAVTSCQNQTSYFVNLNLTGNGLDPRLLREIFLANQSRIRDRINADTYFTDLNKPHTDTIRKIKDL